eukprot:Hpha_TRINITY_DN9431_c0_g1::TRINITY_DN9431_c0_g1_i1::g.139245::m.139245
MDNTIVFQCGVCHQQARGIPGSTVECPYCHQRLKVPGDSPAEGAREGGHAPYGSAPVYGVGGVQPGYTADGQFWYSDDMMPAGKGAIKERLGAQEGEWTTNLMGACCKQPLWCLAGAACCPCVVYYQRRKLLMADKECDNWKYYHCCAGIWGKCCTRICDPCTHGNSCTGCFCACLESFCCTTCAAHGNRYMVMLHYGLRPDCCDTALFWLVCICQVCAFISGDDTLELAADLIWCSVMGCMAAQHASEFAQKGYPAGQMD